MRNNVVYIYDEGTYGVVISYGAHASLVKYTVGGLVYEVVMENEEFKIIEDGEE